jgi:hypothetical protein
MRAFAVAKALLISSAACLGGCKSKAENPPAPVATPSASAPVRLPEPTRRHWPLPSGPVLAILAGQGVGPIRIGATVATIERHMALPCEVKTPEVCRYPARGVDFRLENGVTKTIYVQRAGRPVEGGGEYGFFNGAIPPDLQLGMIPKAIQEHLGPPRSIETSNATGPALRVETHTYDGLRIEYDRIENGNLVMGGISIVREPTPEGGAGPSAKTPAAASAKPSAPVRIH